MLITMILLDLARSIAAMTKQRVPRKETHEEVALDGEEASFLLHGLFSLFHRFSF